MKKIFGLLLIFVSLTASAQLATGIVHNITKKMVHRDTVYVPYGAHAGYVATAKSDSGDVVWMPAPTGSADTIQCVQSRTVNISSAQILNSHNSPITLIPAAGSGKFIQILNYSYIYTFGTTPYTIPTATGTVMGDSLVFTSIDISQSTNTYSAVTNGTSPQPTTFVNKPLRFFSLGSNPTNGDGRLQITIAYLIIDTSGHTICSNDTFDTQSIWVQDATSIYPKNISKFVGIGIASPPVPFAVNTSGGTANILAGDLTPTGNPDSSVLIGNTAGLPTMLYNAKTSSSYSNAIFTVFNDYNGTNVVSNNTSLSGDSSQFYDILLYGINKFAGNTIQNNGTMSHLALTNATFLNNYAGGNAGTGAGQIGYGEAWDGDSICRNYVHNGFIWDFHMRENGRMNDDTITGVHSSIDAFQQTNFDEVSRNKVTGDNSNIWIFQQYGQSEVNDNIISGTNSGIELFTLLNSSINGTRIVANNTHMRNMALFNSTLTNSSVAANGVYMFDWNKDMTGVTDSLVHKMLIGADVEIGNTTTPRQFKYVDGNQGSNKVLTSDVDGNATWATPQIPNLNSVTSVGNISQSDIFINQNDTSQQTTKYGVGGISWQYHGDVTTMPNVAAVIGFDRSGFTPVNSLEIDADNINMATLNTDSTLTHLKINGNIQIIDGTQGTGKVLTSNSAGLGSWKPIPLPDTTQVLATKNDLKAFSGLATLAQADSVATANNKAIYQYSTPTTGQTVNSNGAEYLVINPAGALLALTVTFPASPVNGQIFNISSTQAITTTTFTSSGTIDGNLTGIAANGTAGWIYVLSITTWVKIHN